MPYLVLKQVGGSLVLHGEYENFTLAFSAYKEVPEGIFAEIIEKKSVPVVTVSVQAPVVTTEKPSSIVAPAKLKEGKPNG